MIASCGTVQGGMFNSAMLGAHNGSLTGAGNQGYGMLVLGGTNNQVNRSYRGVVIGGNNLKIPAPPPPAP